MKKLNLLRTWTRVLFILSMIAVIFSPGLFLINMIKPDMVPSTFRFNGSGDFSFIAALIALLTFAGYCLFVYALHLFRKVLDLFNKRKFFEAEVTVLLSKTGQFIFYGALLYSIPQNIYYAFTQNAISIDFVAFWIIVFVFSTGLFFTVLGEVFKMAKTIKDENDLTV